MKLLDLVIDLAQQAGEVLRRHRLDTSMLKIVGETQGDVTRAIDLEVENRIITRLKELDVPCLLVCEEHGLVKIGEDPKYVIVLDPLDGSANYVSNLPFYSVSIAAGEYRPDVKLSDLKVSVVNYVPQNVMYISDVSTGTFKIEGQDIKFTEFPHEKPTFVLYLEPRDIEKMLKFLQKFWNKFPDLKVRIFGSASVEITQTLLRKFTAFIDIRGKLRVVDIAGAYVMAKVLNAHMVDLKGRDLGEYKILDLPRFSLVVTYDDAVLRELLNILSEVE